MIIFALALAAADNSTTRAEDWARKAKPIAQCRDEGECDRKWAKATEWVRHNSRYQAAVDRPDLFATYGAVYANTDLSFVLVRRVDGDGRLVIAARAWCGNVITCHPKPGTAVAGLVKAIDGD